MLPLFQSLRAIALLLVLASTFSVRANDQPSSSPTTSTSSATSAAQPAQKTSSTRQVHSFNPVKSQSTFKENVKTPASKIEKDSIMTMKTPGTVLELMENVRDVFNNRMAFDESFFAEENIRRITSAQRITITRYAEPPRIEAVSYDFRTLKHEEYGVGLSVDFRLEAGADGKKIVVVRGRSHRDQPHLHYSVVEKMFGYPWETSAPEPWGSNRIMQTPTDPHGNTEKEHSQQQGGITEKVNFGFDAAGCLDNFTLRSEETQ